MSARHCRQTCRHALQLAYYARAAQDRSTIAVNTIARPSVFPIVGLAARSFAPMTVTRLTPSHAAEDADLVRAAQRGDQAAFGELYDRYARVVHGILLARVRRADVEDLVQDVFLVAWTRLAGLREPAAFGGWLAMIARNRATDLHRRAHDLAGLPAELPAQDATSERAQALELLAIVRTLPDAYRETLVLRLVEGFTGPEIAERTGLTPASVRVNLHRGFRMLRERLEGRRESK